MTIDTGERQWPLVARWTKSTEDGVTHWFLGGLHSDGRFWGYAHFRLPSRQENQSFSGTLTGDVLVQIASLVDDLASDSPNDLPEHSLGLIGIGTRSSCRVIFERPFKTGNNLNPRFIAAFDSFVELLQPFVTKGIDESEY